MSVRLVAFATLCTLGLAACSDAPTDVEVAPAPWVKSFTASATQLSRGESVTLQWAVENAQTVTLTALGSGTVPGVDATAQEGSVTVALERTTRFVLGVEGASGSDARQLTVAVPLQPVAEATLLAQPSQVLAGEPVTLVWNAPTESGLSLTDGHGTPLDTLGQGRAGAIDVRPLFDTRYQLTFAGGTRTVEVDVLPSLLELEVTPKVGEPGAPLTVSWKGGGGHTLTLSSPGRGILTTQTAPELISQGSFTDTVPATLPANGLVRYEAVLSDGTNPSSRAIDVYVGVQPRVESFSVPAYAEKGGQFFLNWQTLNADQVDIAVGGVVRYQTPNAAVARSGSLSLPSPAQTVMVELRATNRQGGSVSARRPLSPVGPAQVQTFDASTAVLPQGGEPVTLSWKVDQARQVKIVANNEVTVFSSEGESVGEGSVAVYPNAHTTYTLHADNGLGNRVSASTTVDVTQPLALTPSGAGLFVTGSSMDVSVSLPTGTPRIWGLPHDDVVKGPTPSSGFESIQSTGRKLTFSSTDNAVTSFTADFETWLWGQRLSANDGVQISTNGYGVFGAAAVNRASPVPLPSRSVEPNLFAPFWADLRLSASGGVYWQVLGEAPHRELVIEWNGLEVVGEPNSQLTFQARIHQTGVWTFRYGTVQTQNGTRTVGVQGAYRNRSVFGKSYVGTVDAGSEVHFFGPLSPPAHLTLAATGTYSGFVEVGNGYVQVAYQPELVNPNEVFFSEVLAEPVSSLAATGEWVELTNSTPRPLNLAGFQLDFGGGQVHVLDPVNGSTVVPAYGVLVLGQSNLPAENDGVNVDYVYGPAFSLPAQGATLALHRGATLASLGLDVPPSGVALANDVGPLLASSDAPGTPPHAEQCAATTPFGTQAPSQLGSPGNAMGCFPYALQSIPGAFDDLEGVGTELLATASSYTGTGTVILPVPFTYFGTLFSSVQVSMAGFLSFGPPLTSAYDTTNNTLPQPSAPNAVVAVFWDQIVRNSGGHLWMHRRADHTVISWQDFRIFGANNNDMNFQVKLFDSGILEFHYGAMGAGASSTGDHTGSSATTWIENLSGNQALVAHLNQLGGILPHSGFRFVPRP